MPSIRPVLNYLTSPATVDLNNFEAQARLNINSSFNPTPKKPLLNFFFKKKACNVYIISQQRVP
jgi:hypothetical protein